MLIKLFHIFNINNIDVDKELEYIRVNATEKLARCSDWKNDSILLYDNLSNQISLKRYYANYKHKNNWGHETGGSDYKIIANNNDVLWIKNTYEEPMFFLKTENTMSAISYEHKIITIYSNPQDKYLDIKINRENNNFDEIIMKSDNKNYRHNKTDINLSEYFEKGLNWSKDWDKEITKIIQVENINSQFKIVIENSTYPHNGYFILDVDKNIVIETKKC
jgi:hypothetical protein